MKKLILLAFVFSSAVFVATAQDSSTRITPLQPNTATMFAYRTYRFSFSAMPLLGWMRNETKNLGSDGSRLGWNIGLTGEKNFNSNVSVTLGLNIAEMGGRIQYPNLTVISNDTSVRTASDVQYTYKTRYVEIPLLLKLRSDEFGYSRIFGEAGIGAGLLWRAKADLNKNLFPSSDLEGNKDRNVNAARSDFDGLHSSVPEDNINFFRLSLVLGFGYEYALSQNTTFSVGFRYSGGLNNVMRADKTEAFNNFAGINVGILF